MIATVARLLFALDLLAAVVVVAAAAVVVVVVTIVTYVNFEFWKVFGVLDFFNFGK